MLIGRAPQLQRLTAALDRSASRAGRTVLLSGSEGIGKSRVARELMAVASRRGHVVLAARSYPLEQHLDYAPVIASLGHYLPDLQAPDLKKAHLHQEVARVVERLSQEQPLLWFIDDLHWADLATVELFAYIALRVRNQRVLLMGAYRSAHPNGADQARLPLHGMVRSGLAEEVPLERLEPGHVAIMVGRRLGARPSRTLLEHLESRAMGNAFLVETLLSSLSERGALIRAGGAVSLHPAEAHRPSQGGRQIVVDRLASLNPEERQVLDLLAVMGGSAGQNELAQAVDAHDLALASTLRRLQQAGLISEAANAKESPVWVTLTHPLFQEVLYDALPAHVRHRYHAQVAAALESVSPLPVGRLLRHYEGSGGGPNPERALQFLQSEAKRAATGPGHAASHYYRAALALVRGGLHTALLPTVLVELAQSLAKGGEYAAARVCLREGLEAMQPSDDPLGAARLHIQVAHFDFMLGDLDAARATIEAGLALLAGMGWSPELVTLRGVRGNLDLLLGDTSGIPQLAADLAQAVAALDTPAARAWHSHARMWEELLAFRVTTSLSLAKECLEQAWLSYIPSVIITAAADRGFILLLRGDHRTAAAELRSTLARMPGAAAVPATQSLSPLLITAETLAGNWEEALQISDESVPLEPWIQAWPRGNLGARAVVLIRQGNLERAREFLTGGYLGLLPTGTEFEYAQALLALESGEYQRAAELAAGLHAWGLAVLALPVLAEAQALLGQAENVCGIARALDFMAGLDLPLAAAMGAWVRGLADRSAGKADEAMGAFAQAAEQFGQLAMPFEAARARFEQARLLAAADARGALALARRSLQAFTRLGANLWAERVRAWLAAQDHRARPAKRKTDPSDATALSHMSVAPFTLRELEIIRLLDEGLSNALIAARLVISRRTVATHLERMYARHGVNTRLALVRLARTSGFL